MNREPRQPKNLRLFWCLLHLGFTGVRIMRIILAIRMSQRQSSLLGKDAFNASALRCRGWLGSNKRASSKVKPCAFYFVLGRTSMAALEGSMSTAWPLALSDDCCGRANEFMFGIVCGGPRRVRPVGQAPHELQRCAVIWREPVYISHSGFNSDLAAHLGCPTKTHA